MKRTPLIQLTAALTILALAGTASAAGIPGNTYHLTGTVYLDGKAQPWEIWGRHMPFFLYEKRGNMVTQDDGNTTRRLYGPSSHRKETVAVVGGVSDSPRYQYGYDDIHASDLGLTKEWPLLTNTTSWANAMAKHEVTPASSTSTSAVFSTPMEIYRNYTGTSTNTIFTVSSDGELQSYALHVQRPTGPVDIEKLTAQYDVDIPAEILAPLDTDAEYTYDVAPGDDTSLRAAKVYVKILAVDHDGDILVDGIFPAQKGLTGNLTVPNHILVACADKGGHIDVFPYIETFTKRGLDGDTLLLISPSTPLGRGFHPVIVAPKGSKAFTMSYTLDVDAPMITAAPGPPLTMSAPVDDVPVSGDLDTANPPSTMATYGLKEADIKKYVDARRAAHK